MFEQLHNMCCALLRVLVPSVGVQLGLVLAHTDWAPHMLRVKAGWATAGWTLHVFRIKAGLARHTLHGKVGWLERVLGVKTAQANHLSWIKVDFARHMLQFNAGWAKIG